MKDKLLSLVLLVEADVSDRIEFFLTEAISHLPKDSDQYQVIVVQDGGKPRSPDDFSASLSVTQGLRYICLSQSCGLARALSAGLEAAIGDLCLTFVAAKDPFELIPQFFRRCEQDGGLVVGQRIKPGGEGSWLFRIGRKCFHFIAYNLMGSTFPKHTTLLACFDRAAMNTINQAGDRERYFRALTSYVGIPVQTIPYQLQRIELRSLAESIDLSLDILFLNSTKPLRLVTYLSLGMILASLGYLAYLARAAFSVGTWPSGIVIYLCVASSVLFFVLAIFSEYIHRLLLESRDRPSYTVARDWSTPARVHNMDRPNTTSIADHQKRSVGS